MSHCHTKFQLCSSHGRWVIRNIRQKNASLCWHVRRKMNFWTIEQQEEKYLNRLFCTAFDALSKYIIDLNFIFCSLLRPTFTLFDRHFEFLCRVTETWLQLRQWQSWRCGHYTKREITLWLKKWLEKTRRNQFYLWIKTTRLFEKRSVYSLCRVTIWKLGPL